MMSEGGTRPVMIEQGSWDAGVKKLWPQIGSGEVELIGLALVNLWPPKFPGIR